MFLDRLRRYKLNHILFWLLYALFWLLVSGGIADTAQIINTAIVVCFHALVSYFNIYVLVPALLQKQKYFSYALSLLLSITLTCFPLAIVIYYTTDGADNAQSIWSVEFFLKNSMITSYAVGITMILRLMWQWYQREKEKADLQRLNSETELKYLKSQINPHFLFNCLNSIYALTLKKSDDAPQTVIKLSDMLRYLLYEAGEKKVTIDKEINYLRNYVELEKIRLGNRGKLTLEVETDDDSYLIEPMLIMPFVENSFKHGLNLKATDGWVNIILKVDNGSLFFCIRNNKGVKDNVKADEVGGIGLKNVKKRLEILYPAKHGLKITDDNGVYEVQLTLELN